ncbi:MAG: hypothetical protein M5U12_18130 [Verrucomicrobia bacterium]|nr:hypothetical protein [Verrucomicrobiota bacterium]
MRTLGFLPTARELAAYYRRYVGLVRGLGATPETRYRLEVLKEYLRFVKYLPDPPEHPMLDYVPSWFGKHYLARRTNPPSQKDILVNKIRFYQYMAEQGIACPRTFFL